MAGRSRQRGLALVVVLWATVILAMLATAISHVAREDVILARNLVDATQAELAADSGLHHALERILSHGPEIFWEGEEVQNWEFADGEIRVSVTDESGRIDINAAPASLMANLFKAVGVAPGDAEALAAEVVARREGSAQDLASGAETTQPHGRGFITTEELMGIPGMTRSLFDRISEVITVYTGRQKPRRRYAPPLVIAALEGNLLDERDRAEPGVDAPESQIEQLGTRLETNQPKRRRSSLIRFHSEARAAGGSVFAREAVILVRRRRTGATYQIWLWQRGQRRFF